MDAPHADGGAALAVMTRHTGDDDNHVSVYAIVGIVVVFLLSMAGSMLPPALIAWRPTFDLDHNLFFRFFSGMAAGVVLAVAFVHSLPEAHESFEEALAPLAEAAEAAGQSDTLYTYPWSGFLAMMGAVLTFTLEEVLEQLGVSPHSHEHGHTHAHHASGFPSGSPGPRREPSSVPMVSARGDANETDLASEAIAASTTAVGYGAIGSGGASQLLSPAPDGAAALPEPGMEAIAIPGEAGSISESSAPLESKGHGRHRGAILDMYILLAGLSFHSFFVGLALGVSDSLALFIAIVAHQFLEGVALGARIARARLPKRRDGVFLDLVFALAAPIGCGIGIAIESRVGDTTFTYFVINGLFQSLSAGILIYVAVIHLLSEEMERHGIADDRKGRNVTYVGFVVGCGIMSVLGIWA